MGKSNDGRVIPLPQRDIVAEALAIFRKLPLEQKREILNRLTGCADKPAPALVLLEKDA